MVKPFANVSISNWLPQFSQFTILFKNITYSHSTRVVFKLGNNRLYISCLTWKNTELIFINSKIFYNTDKKLVECFSQFSSLLNNFWAFNNGNAIFRFYFTIKNGSHRLPDLLESVNLLSLLFFHKYTQTFLWISILLFYHSKTFFLILTLTLLLFVTNLEQLTLRYFF